MLITLLLDLDTKGRYRLIAGYKERDITVPLGGKWDARNGWWILSTVPDPLLELNGLQITEAAMKQIQQERDRENLLLSLHSAKDAQVLYGEGIDPYQRVGAKFLATAGRAILADFPGAGKSAQAIRAACEVGAEKILVVTRKSLIHNWKHQFSTWLPNGYEASYEITNYEQVALHLDRYTRKRYDVLIVDEATQVKSRKAKRSQAVYKLAQTVPCVWLLSGTLILNRPDELWMPLHILYPERYTSYWRFVETYCLTEYNPWSSGPKVVGLNPAMKEALSRELAPMLLRRPRSVVDLPPITRETVYVELAGEQKALYRSMLKEFFVMLDEVGIIHAPTVVAQLVRLRQITCTPALLGSRDVSAKTDALLEVVEDYARDYKILVFTSFARYADILAGKLSDYDPVKITGDVSAKQRQVAVETFNTDPNCRVLVGTIGAMGEGLNIQSADIVVFTDKTWVPASVEQAESRAHRRGREDPVHVISMVASNTVDEHVETVLGNKRGVIREMDAIMQLATLLKEKGGV